MGAIPFALSVLSRERLSDRRNGARRQLAALNLGRPGNYVLICYVPDRAGGPPHLAKGMVSEAKVGRSQ